MSTVTVAVARTFSSLRIRNYRIYFIGQLISLSGTWMQSVAQSWLVLKLTGSGTALGAVAAFQFLPVLFLGPLGGVIADRFSKRRLLFFTQTIAGALALMLGILVLTDTVRLWMVFALALGLGLVNAVDNPTRQTFILELVGRDDLTNAVSLNSVLVNLARVFGPAAAGALIVLVGLGECFVLNAASYLAVIVALLVLDKRALHTAAPQPRKKGQLREGFRYVRSTPEVFTPLMMMAVVGMLAYEFQVSLPLVAKFTFGGDAGTYATMSAVMGAGAVVGGLATAARKPRPATALANTAFAFGSVQLLVAAAPVFAVELAALAVLGAASISFLALGNATLQLASSTEMRGRVMALWAVAFLGSTPIGGPIVGAIGEHVGPRYAVGVGGLATVLAALLAYRSLSRIPFEPQR